MAVIGDKFNLYRIIRKHYGPKSSFEGILCYLVAESDVAVYEWLKQEPDLDRDYIDGDWVFTGWSDMEEEGVRKKVYLGDEEDDDYFENFDIMGWSDWVTKNRGDSSHFQGEAYYGIDSFRWMLLSSVSKDDIETFRSLLGQDLFVFVDLESNHRGEGVDE